MFKELGLTIAICAAAMVWVGLALLYAGWSRRIAVATLAGWATMLSSIPLWIRLGGTDRGVAIGLLVVMIGAFLLVGAFADRRARRAPRRSEAPDRVLRTAARPIFSHTLLFALCAGPLAGAAAVAVALATVRWFPVAESSRLITVGLLTPVLWGTIALISLYSERPWRPAAALSAVGALGLLHYV
jgi:hypothetical protein